MANRRQLSRDERKYMISEARRNIARTQAHVRDFQNRVDMTEISARALESKMIKIIGSFAEDENLDFDKRFAAAKEVLDRARGSVIPKMGIQDHDLHAEDSEGKTLEIHIDEARQAAERMMEANKIVGSVPPEEWPDWLKLEYGPAEMAIWSGEKDGGEGEN